MADNSQDFFPEPPEVFPSRQTSRLSQDEESIPWWKYALAALPAINAGVQYGARGQQTPDQFNEPLRQLAGQRKYNALLRDLGPIAEKYPVLKEFLPLLRHDPKLLRPFLEHALTESAKVPLETLPNWWTAAGFEKPLTPPAPQIETLPGGIVPGDAPLPPVQFLPPSPEQQQEFEAFQRSGQRRVDPEAAQDVIAKARLREIERRQQHQDNLAREGRIEERQKEVDRQRAEERKELDTIRRGERTEEYRQRQHDREALQAERRGERQEASLETLRERYRADLVRSGANPQDLTALDAATSREALRAAYTQAWNAATVEVTLGDGSVRKVSVAKAEQIRREQAVRKEAQEKAESTPLGRELKALNDQLRNAYGRERIELNREIFRKSVAYASNYGPWSENKRLRTNGQQVAAMLAKKKTADEKLTLLADIKRRMMGPGEDGTILVGVTADEILGLEQAITASQAKK